MWGIMKEDASYDIYSSLGSFSSLQIKEGLCRDITIGIVKNK